MPRKKKPQHLHFIDMGIFPGNILFVHGFEYDEIIAVLNKKKLKFWADPLSEDKELIDGGENFALKRVMENSKTKEERTYYYIILKKFSFIDYDYCKLAHEILHITQFHLPDILKRDKEIEAEAYLHTYIMDKCLTVMRGKNYKA